MKGGDMTYSTKDIPAEGLSACWKSPSNIALIKYWGKLGGQLPANASLSITLSNAYTVTRVAASRLDTPGSGPEAEFRFEGELNLPFSSRINTFLKSVASHFQYLPDVKLSIESGNSFPHSAGIASSASGMSALALCLCALEAQFQGKEAGAPGFYEKASSIARLGSGSACRSVYGGITVWGRHHDVPGSSDEYAVPLHFDPHPLFSGLRDAILIVDPGEKKVSSSVGHGLMNGHPFAESRFAQAGKNLSGLLAALKSGDWQVFARIVENEALSLHAMMLASDPWFILMHPNSLLIINKIEEFRKQTEAKVCFTLDAGPNIHLLYPEEETERVATLIKSLKSYCFNDKVIEDLVGEGPKQLTCR
ncbi:diphosphomevalonate decarboxylase [Lentimicrobium sp.]|jgi:diphosphomevalonate decarboxylase|uniref:diphosphomevalonate decarboxylase n=2 Tax=Lentimicrobium sp. TaxID=2034841 RepID=UPI002D1FAB0B|nr:diphosphomevalonate decarboxylase [Lentimicrobium sp.]